MNAADGSRDADVATALAWAEWLGVNIVSIWLLGLLLVLSVAGLSGLMIRRAVAWTAGSRDPADRVSAADPAAVDTAAAAVTPLPVRLALPCGFLLRLGAGFAVIVGGALLFAAMLDALDADEALGRFDTRLAQVLAETLSPSVLRIFSVATHLGDPWTLTAIVVVVAVLLKVRGRSALAAGWVVGTAGSGIVNRVLKGVFERVRPLHEHGFSVADGFSFPSGHTSGSVVVYGMLAYLALRLMPTRAWLPVVLVAAGLAWSMGVSRVILQVHWASDVVAGFGSGLAWLVVVIVGIETLRHWRRRRAGAATVGPPDRVS